MAQETQYTSYPEVVDHRVYWHQPEVARNLYAVPDSTLEYAGKAAEKEIVIGPLLQTRPTKPVWYQRHWLLALLGVGIVVIGIAIGCGVGLTRRNAAAGGEPSAGSSSSASSFPSPGANKSDTSACHQTICQQVLSALASSEPDTLTVFGLGTDKSIWYRTGDGSAKWSSDWLSWGSSFVTGAAAAVVGNRSFALAVSETSKSVQARENKWGSWSLTTDLGGPVGAAPVVCARPDWSFLWVWSLDVASGGLPIQRWTNTTLGDLTPWGPEPFKQRVAARGTPGLACRRSTVFHDLAIYAKDNGGLLITHFNYTGGATGGVGVWADWDYLGGSFVGHPVLVTVDTTRFDFFGIGTDKQMYHLSWTEMTGNSLLEPLGGSFASVPSAFVSADKRIDIVALGTDGKLKHRSLVGTTWSPEWEDLGIFANSAPLLVETAGRPEKVSLFFVGERGEMQYASWTISQEVNWKRVVTPKGIGGNFTGIPPLYSDTL